MTEPTISEVLAQYPDCKEFVDAKGIIWTREDGALKSSEGFNSWQIFEGDIGWTTRMAIPGLKPRPKKRKVKVTETYYAYKDNNYSSCGSIYSVTTDRSELEAMRCPPGHSIIELTGTYETEEPEPIKLKTRSEMAAEDLERQLRHRGIR